MPIYEYRCDACGKEFEALVSMSAPTPTCEHCGAPGDSVHKKVSAAGFLLKGSGWYKDHYGLKGGSSSSASDGSSSSSSSTSSTTSSSD